MSPVPLILNFGLVSFCFTEPVSWPVTAIVCAALGWNAALYYAAKTIDYNPPRKAEVETK